MGRPRGDISSTIEGNNEVARFRHPLLPGKKVIRVSLGRGDEAVENLRVLNLISRNREYWQTPPKGHVSKAVLEAWYGSAGAGDAETEKAGEITVPGNTKTVPTTGRGLALETLLALRDRQIERLKKRVHVLEKQLEQALGRRIRKGPCPTLEQALRDFMDHYKDRDADHTQNVENDLQRFIDHFDAKKEVDFFDGREREIQKWLRSLSVSPSRRNQIRTYVLKFLDDSGLKMDREAVETVGVAEVRRRRGPIRWLERADAEKLRDALKQPWRDMFRLQVGLGLRPDELITLKRCDFNSDFSELTLSVLGGLTLKTGSRSIQVPKPLRSLIAERLQKKERTLLFPAIVDGRKLRKGMKKDQKHAGDQVELGKPWPDAKIFNKHYNAALTAAAPTVGITMEVDCRTGRRTCGSLLLRSKKASGQRYSVEDVAAILGDKPKTIYEHYGRILSGEVDPSGAVI